ncbi:MAG: HNH endonuclease [Victivallaceae bacterium]|nr:HNH endonuclease [Victivallaceae bacterium]
MSKLFFIEWLRRTKDTITRPEKYASTVNTISNDLKKKDIPISSLYDISDPMLLSNLKDQYLNFEDYFKKNKTGNRMYSRAFDLLIEFTHSDFEDAIKDIQKTLQDESIPITERESIAKSRIGQGKFRDNLIDFWKQCSITGYNDIRLLRASHIKPWKESDNRERLDVYNGLLLLPNLDLVFDKGFITFDRKGKIVISSSLVQPELLGVDDAMSVCIKPRHNIYMDYHRDEVFEHTA